MSQAAPLPPLYRLLQLLSGTPDPQALSEAQQLLADQPDLPRQSIHAAAMIGDVDTLQKHIEIDAALVHDKVEPAGATPLIMAALSRYAQTGVAAAKRIARGVEVLLEHGADPAAGSRWDAADEQSKFSAVDAAAGVSGNAPVLRVLLEAGAEATSGVALLQAAARGYLDCLALLQQYGADFNQTRHAGGYPPLHWVLEVDFDPAVVEWLLDHGADPNVTIEPYGETALHVAVRRRRLESIDALLQAGADMDARTTGGKTAYAHACRRGFDDVAVVLEERGADPTLTASEHLAVLLLQDEIDAARELIEQQPELVLLADPEEARILPDLAARGRLDAVILLLDAGADLESRGLDGGTALHQAAWFGQPDMVRLLLGRGALINITGDWHESTPLGWAAHGSSRSGGAAERQDAYVQIVEMLLDAGATLRHPNDSRDDADAAWLLADASPEVAEVLRRHGA